MCGYVSRKILSEKYLKYLLVFLWKMLSEKYSNTQAHKHTLILSLSLSFNQKYLRSDLFYVKYSICPSDNQENISVWDTVLGAKWDLLPGKEGQFHFVIRQMKNTETNTMVLVELNQFARSKRVIPKQLELQRSYCQKFQ